MVAKTRKYRHEEGPLVQERPRKMRAESWPFWIGLGLSLLFTALWLAVPLVPSWSEKPEIALTLQWLMIFTWGIVLGALVTALAIRTYGPPRPEQNSQAERDRTKQDLHGSPPEPGKTVITLLPNGRFAKTETTALEEEEEE